MSISYANHLYFESIKHQTRVIKRPGFKRNHPYMKSEMNCKRLQVGQFWSARPRGHNRWLHQVRANYSCISCHATFQHFLPQPTQYISVENIHALFPAAAPWLCLAYSPIPRSFSWGGGLAEDFAVSHPLRSETIYCACKTSEHVSACTYVPWKVRAALIAKFLKCCKGI